MATRAGPRKGRIGRRSRLRGVLADREIDHDLACQALQRLAQMLERKAVGRPQAGRGAKHLEARKRRAFEAARELFDIDAKPARSEFTSRTIPGRSLPRMSSLMRREGFSACGAPRSIVTRRPPASSRPKRRFEIGEVRVRNVRQQNAGELARELRRPAFEPGRPGRCDRLGDCVHKSGACRRRRRSERAESWGCSSRRMGRCQASPAGRRIAKNRRLVDGGQ